MAALTRGDIGRRRSIALQGLGRDDLRVVPFVRAQTAPIKMREGRALACGKLGSHRDADSTRAQPRLCFFSDLLLCEGGLREDEGGVSGVLLNPILEGGRGFAGEALEGGLECDLLEAGIGKFGGPLDCAWGVVDDP